MSSKPAARSSSTRVCTEKIFTIGALPSQRITASTGLYGTQESPRHTVEETKKPPGFSRSWIRARASARSSIKCRML